MGSFYVNLCVKTNEVAALLPVLESTGSKGILVDDESGWLVVTTEQIETQNQTEIDLLGQAITEKLSVMAVSFLNHDDDMLSVDVYAKGLRVGSYNSAPWCFVEDPSPEDMKPKLVNPAAYAALGDDISEEDVSKVFEPDISFIFAPQLHADIAGLLGLSMMSVGFGYRYAVQGDFAAAKDKMVAFGGAVLN